MKESPVADRLLEAGLQLFSEKGYLGATTRKIAEAAGVTEITLFRHFGSKEKLFEEVLRRCMFLPTLSELLPELNGLSYQKALAVFGTRFLHSLKERKALVRIMLSELNAYPDKARVVHRGVMDQLTNTLGGYLKSLKGKEVRRGLAPELAAKAFLGMVFSYYLAEEIVAGRDLAREEMEKAVEQFADLFVNGTRKRARP